MGNEARTKLLEEVRRRRRLRARRDRAGMRRVMRLGALAIVVVASCSMLPKDLRASTPRTAAPTPATAAAGYRALPFALGDIDKQLSAAVLATAPRVTRPDFAMKD